MKVVAQLSIELEQRRWLENKAEEEDRSMAEVVRTLIRKEMEKEKEGFADGEN